jgi:hypothetical protein
MAYSVYVPTKHPIVLPLDYGSHKQKDIAVYIRRVENLPEFDMAIYPTERD